MIRAFVAVVLDDDTRTRLAAEVERLRGVARDVAWVAPANLHITIKFLGEVEQERIEHVRAELAVVASVGNFGLTIRGIGAFPSPHRPRVVWAGIGAGSTDLARLAERVEAALVPCGFAPETRAFSAHVTLGRVRRPRPNAALEAAIMEAGIREFGNLRVDRITLMRSELQPRGPVYTEIAGWSLSTGLV